MLFNPDNKLELVRVLGSAIPTRKRIHWEVWLQFQQRNIAVPQKEMQTNIFLLPDWSNRSYKS